MKEAIEKAIEGGWPANDSPARKLGVYGFETYSKADLAQMREDPLFWQSLGKALGWGKDFNLIITHPNMGPVGSVKDKTLDWKYHWHRFIDHLAEGKDPSEFFTSLIK